MRGLQAFWADAIASELAPTGISVVSADAFQLWEQACSHRDQRRVGECISIVGASLLAMAA
ncbi:hypothetical protein C9I49_02920 [Pseudomonas prosekii]|uniref:Uncharacterized protein n=1 Tax=Pseudomonas prosekii TaxID=1148509 RepID=A0A2U2DDQ7_9PSED|nr:hypothetical protein C9I49_02920 [Pseudomonas prosekii]